MPKTRISKLDLTEINRAVLAIEDEIDRVREQFSQLRSGKLPFTGDLDLGNFRITNAGTAESDDDTLTLGELQNRIFDIEEAELNLETSAAADGGAGAKAGRLARRTSQLVNFAEEAAATLIDGVATPGVVFVNATGDLDTDEANFVWDDGNNRLGLLTAAPSHTLHVATGGFVRIEDLTAGSVLFAGASGVVSQDNANLFWDDSTNRLGILDATPSATLSVGATSQFQVGSDGDLDRIKDVPYSWPAANAAGVLLNDGAGALSWTIAATGIDHGGLSGLTDDDHAQYLLRVGRTGTTNDAIISTDADGSLTGSELAAFDLILRANNEAQAFANAGRVRINDRAVLWEDIPDLSGTTTTHVSRFNATMTITGGASAGCALHGHRSDPALTFLGANGTTASYFGFSSGPAITLGSTNSTQSVVSGFYNDAVLTITGDDSHTTTSRTIQDFPIYTTALTATNTSSHHIGCESYPTFIASAAGAALTFNSIGFRAGGAIDTQDAAAAVHLGAQNCFVASNLDVTGTGTATVDAQVGLRVNNLTAGTINCSVQSVGSAVQMRHVGPVRIGEDAAPTEKLEVLGNILIDNSGTAGELRLREPSAGGSSYTSFKSPALAANVNYTLPPDDGDAGEQLTTDGSGVLTWEAAGGSASLGTHTFVRFTGSDTRNNTTAFANANDGTNTLQFAVGTSQTWVFRCVLRMEAPNATGDMKVQFTGPATVTAFAAGGARDEVGVADPTHINALSTSSGRISLVAVTNHTVTIHGMIVTDGTNSGNVTLQWAQNTANANNFFMRPTSFIHAQRIA